jgi:hypothetical protein
MSLTKKDQQVIGEILIENNINHLPTKDEYFKESAKVYQKLQDIEDEMLERIKKLESVVL